jgi:hypothetical protein
MKAQNEIVESLFNELWDKYINRVTHAKSYVEIVEKAGGNIVNDHIALRTFKCNTGDQPSGIEAMRRVFEPLGYVQKGEYVFKVKKLFAVHFEHPDPIQPKVFVSELQVDQLGEDVKKTIEANTSKTEDKLSAKAKSLLAELEVNKNLSDTDAEILVSELTPFFSRTWSAPKRSDVEALNVETQYAAWTLLHGNSVNHFTAFINHQNVAAWPDIDSTVKGLLDAGVPMKSEIEGEPGSKLRQSSTKAVLENCEVIEDDGSKGTIEWSYAYYELAERNDIEIDGKMKQFTGFLGEQATHLFEMTKKD